MRLIRLLLFPFSFIYALGVVIRNLAYDYGILKSRKFRIPIISVGNLTVGGAGKSPMAEYLVLLLKDRYKLATLSRGYGRKTRGFVEVTINSTSKEVGDEPRQFKQKFPEIAVAVCESRIEGIKNLNQVNEIIVLDDAYQHRSVRPGLSILLFDYTSLFNFQWFLPTGNLREPLSGRKRANIIVVTKTPANLDSLERKRMISRVNPFPHQHVFFSYLVYKKLRLFENETVLRDLKSLTPQTQVLLLTGIANAVPLVNELNRYTTQIQHHHYSDHHNFSTENISKLVAEFHNLKEEDKLIITTEKDIQRLKPRAIKWLLKDLPVYFLPVEVKIHEPDEATFNNLIQEYVTKYTTNNRVHKTKNR